MFDLAFENIISASVVSHRSLLQLPADLEVRVFVRFYLSILNDPPALCRDTFPPANHPSSSTHAPPTPNSPLESSAQADAIFGEDKFAPGYKREYFDSGGTRGLAVRGDMTDPVAKKAIEGRCV